MHLGRNRHNAHLNDLVHFVSVGESPRCCSAIVAYCDSRLVVTVFVFDPVIGAHFEYSVRKHKIVGTVAAHTWHHGHECLG